MTAPTAREAQGFHNGAVWQAPNLLRVVLTWLDGDQWALMSDPEPSRHGGRCMIPHADVKGQWLWDGDQLPDRLEGWTYLPNETLAPLTAKREVLSHPDPDIAARNCAPRPDSESPGSTSPPTLADGKRDFAGGRETGATAVQQPTPPFATLWQHGEEGRLGVEFDGEPRSYSHMAGWQPIGRLALIEEDAAIQQPPKETKMNISINGTTHQTDAATLTYADIIQMDGYKPDRILSVTYHTRRKGDEQRQGILSPGKSVRIEDGMIFNVADTSNA